MKAVQMSISGKVQGVFFRVSTVEKAQELKLTGWVQNEEDGSVSIHAEGEEAALNALVEWCHKGPEMAVVGSVITVDIEPQGFTEFEKRRRK